MEENHKFFSGVVFPWPPTKSMAMQQSSNGSNRGTTSAEDVRFETTDKATWFTPCRCHLLLLVSARNGQSCTIARVNKTLTPPSTNVSSMLSCPSSRNLIIVPPLLSCGRLLQDAKEDKRALCARIDVWDRTIMLPVVPPPLAPSPAMLLPHLFHALSAILYEKGTLVFFFTRHHLHAHFLTCHLFRAPFTCHRLHAHFHVPPFSRAPAASNT